MDNPVGASTSSSSSLATQESPASFIQSNEDTKANAIDGISHPISKHNLLLMVGASWSKWYAAFKYVLPFYITIHIAFFLITCLSVLFILKDFSAPSMSFPGLLSLWLRWDTINFRAIAVNGYTILRLTAFFPLYPLLERSFIFITHNALIAGLIVSNLAGLGMLVVLYRLVQEDFDHERALRTILYLSVFPAAFFFAAAYSESLFLFLSLLSFYHMRHAHWWLAGLFGFLAVLTRTTGFFLFIPFCYEYLRHHNFNLKTIRFDIASCIGFFAGIGIFALYCYIVFHDPLAFSHAEAFWNRKLSIPGYGMLRSVKAIIVSQGILSFQAFRNILDLVPDLFIGVLVILGFVGPWKFPGNLRVYIICAATLYLFPQLFPFGGLYPLESMSRYLLAVFPAFIVLAGIGKNRTFDISYLMISSFLLFFLLIQFLTGHWIT